ncbi:peptide-methionine (R)-S-oxide reductase MsrB [Congregibacter brevis]|uniref:peptide-methionine (R)-S-oxide reductase n=1 Tax=Congregibacter brevis TaxID=3081201 RepID=A0ABZ0IE95_9GAMM|nr:peptide-methionine (R)-S-oxide reductase MsrB [Congregibacter sp. IMCC45268]
MKRREFLSAISKVAIGATAALSAPVIWANSKASMMLEEIHSQWRDFLPEGFTVVSAEDKLKLSKDEWRERLDEPLAYDVLRRESTERPFTSALNDEKRDGVYVCSGCELPVFTSQMKFDSGTGWPSFFTTVPGSMETKKDFKLILPRTEYHCARCGGHHGHVFNDGPAPTGQRWCNNGVSLRFVAKAG